MVRRAKGVSERELVSGPPDDPRQRHPVLQTVEMFEHAERLWMEYVRRSGWPETDERHEVAAEVSVRLRQLSHIILRIRQWEDRLRASQPSPRQLQEWLRLCAERDLVGREVTIEDHISVFGIPSERFPKIEDWEDLSVWTESFYYFAFRLQKLLQRADLGVRRVEAKGIAFVRNQLIEHPESHPAKVHRQWTIYTTDGPVLRHEGAVVVATDGTTHAVGSFDAGLFSNAEELRQELEDSFLQESSAS